AAVAQLAAADPVGAGPGRDPHVAAAGFHYLVDERVAEAVGHVEGLPGFVLLVEDRESAAVRADRDAAAQPSHPDHAIREQAMLVVVELVRLGPRVVAHHAARGANPNDGALGID